MSKVSEAIMTTLGVDDEVAASTEAQLRHQLEAGGHQVSDDALIKAIPQISQGIKAGSQGSQPGFIIANQQPQIEEVTVDSKPTNNVIPTKPAYNAIDAYQGASDRYKNALEEIKSKRNNTNMGQAILSRFNNNRVSDSNKEFDSQEAKAKEETLGEFGRRDQVQMAQDQRDRTKTIQGREDTKYGQEQDQEKISKDPNSMVSKKAREVLGITDPNISYYQLGQVYPMIKDQLDADLKREQIAATRDTAASNRELKTTIDAATKAAAAERDTNSRTEKLADVTSVIQGGLQAVDNIDTIIQTLTGKKDFKVDNYNPQTGKYKDAADKSADIDLPGMSVPGLGRITALSGDARQLNQALSSVFNTVLRDRSGAAVTNPEMERLKAEFGSGSWNTEADLLNGLQQYKKSLSMELKNREAGFSPKVIDRYEQQGGTTSNTRGASGSWDASAPVGKVRKYNPATGRVE